MSRFIALGCAILVAGCSSNSTPPVTEATAPTKTEDAHAHKPGKHGGALIPIGSDKYHAEAVFEKGGTVRLFTLGQNEAAVLEVEVQELSGSVRAITATDWEPFVLAPTPQPGDKPGTTSQFTGTLPKSLAGKRVVVKISAIRIGGERFRIAFESAPATDEHAIPAKVVDDDGREVPRGALGKLAVIGPTGCRYLNDARQAMYVKGGWNFPGDTFTQDADGYFFYHARADDMIVTAGYNVAGPEVESCLLAHPAVAECGVVGAADAARGQIVKAYVVLRTGHKGDAAMKKALQDYVKAAIAPYKDPRAVEFVAELPRTETGKLQRFKLRQATAG